MGQTKLNFFQRNIETLPRLRTQGDASAAATATSAAASGLPIGPKVKNDGKPYKATTVKAGPRAGLPRNTENLNGKAKVSAEFSGRGSDQAVWCQEASFAFLAQKEYVDQVAQSVADTERFFNHPGRSPKKINELVSEIQQMPAEHRQTVGNRGFGKWAKAVAKGMEKIDLPMSGGIFGSGTHALAARIEIKHDGMVDITGYNIDDGSIVQKIPTRHIDSLDDLKLEDVFPEIRNLYDDPSNVDALSMAALCPDVALPHPESLPYFEDIKTIKDPKALETARKEVMTIAMHQNQPDAFKAICADLKADGIVGDKALPYLMGRSKDGLRASQWIPQECLPKLLRTYGEGAAALGVSGTKAVQLISALFERMVYEVDAEKAKKYGNKDPRAMIFGRPRLHSMLETDPAGLNETLKAVGDFMEMCNVPADDVMKVLNCFFEGDRGGMNLFGRAVRANQPEVLRTIISLTSQLKLGALDRKQIYEGGEKVSERFAVTALQYAKSNKLTEIAKIIEDGMANRWN